MSGMWRVGEEAVAVSARPEGKRADGYTVMLGDRSVNVTARVAPDGTVTITMPDGQRYRTAVSRDATNAACRWVTVGSTTCQLHEVELGSDGQEESGGLEAPMPGKVLSVAVSAGDVVEAGAVLLVVEAMKMEHAVRAPAAGIVHEVRAAAGDMVSPGTPLVDFEVSE